MDTLTYKEGDLFTFVHASSLNTCIGKNGGPYDFGDYSLGYFKAAELLAQAVPSQPNHIDVLVYPIVYNFRHGIELGLKYLLEKLPVIYGDTVPSMRATHELVDVWNAIRPYLTRDIAFDEHSTKVLFVDGIIKDILKFDPYAEVFRFPKNRGGDFYLQDEAFINIGTLGEFLDEVSVIFEDWFIIVGAMLEGE